MFGDFIHNLLNRLMHHHEWLYAGIDYRDKETKYYWHLEECRWCDKRRSVINSDHCACGGK